VTFIFIGAGPGRSGRPDQLLRERRTLIARCPVRLYAGSWSGRAARACRAALHHRHGTNVARRNEQGIRNRARGGSPRRGNGCIQENLSIYKRARQSRTRTGLRRARHPLQRSAGVPGVMPRRPPRFGRELTVPEVAQSVVLTPR